MSKTARSIYFSGWVLLIFGAILIFLPQQVMLFFWKDLVADYWLRTLGFFMLMEGMFCYKSSFYEITPLYRWVLNFRLFQPIFFVVLLLVDYANPGLMLYSTLELLLGLYSFLMYKSEYSA